MLGDNGNLFIIAVLAVALFMYTYSYQSEKNASMEEVSVVDDMPERHVRTKGPMATGKVTETDQAHLVDDGNSYPVPIDAPIPSQSARRDANDPY